MTEYRYHTTSKNNAWVCGYVERSEDGGQTWLHMANTEWARAKVSFPLPTDPFPEPEQWARGSEPIPELSPSAYLPPEFAGHTNPGLMKRGPQYARDKLYVFGPEPDINAFKPAERAIIMLYTWILSEHEKVPLELRDQYP